MREGEAVVSASDLPDVGDREAVARTLHSKMNAHVLMVCGEVGKLWDELQEETRETWMAVSESVQRLVADAVAKANTTLDALRADRDEERTRYLARGERDAAELVALMAERDALRAERDALAAYKRRTSGLVGELERERDAATRLKDEAVGLVKNIRDAIACSSTIELASSVGGSALDGRDVKRGVLLIFDVFLRATDAGGKSNTGASEGGSNG